jgi:hypothetical protein
MSAYAAKTVMAHVTMIVAKAATPTISNFSHIMRLPSFGPTTVE